MLRQRVHTLDPADGQPGQVPRINDAGTGVEWGDASEVLTSMLAHLVTTDAAGDFVDVWTEDGEHLYVEVPL